jgi:hypothetical protein
MPKTNADYQREHRKRQADRLADLQAENAELRAERDRLQADLDAALCEAQRLATAACKHPAAAVDGDTRRACGNEIW